MKRRKDHMYGFILDLMWAVGTGLRLPLPVELRNGQPQNRTKSKMGCNYLGLNDVGIELLCEVVFAEEGTGAMRFKPP